MGDKQTHSSQNVLEVITLSPLVRPKRVQIPVGPQRCSPAGKPDKFRGGKMTSRATVRNGRFRSSVAPLKREAGVYVRMCARTRHYSFFGLFGLGAAASTGSAAGPRPLERRGCLEDGPGRPTLRRPPHSIHTCAVWHMPPRCEGTGRHVPYTCKSTQAY
jgi:hypothetical protein